MKKQTIIPESSRDHYDRWHFSPAVESGGFVFVSGCTGARDDGTVSGDLSQEFRQAFETVHLSLREAGLGFDDVVDITTYHVGLQAHLRDFMAVKDKYVPEPYPAWTAVGVTELAVPGANIEIRVIAKR